jgi:hypothetical protein
LPGCQGPGEAAEGPGKLEVNIISQGTLGSGPASGAVVLSEP